MLLLLNVANHMTVVATSHIYLKKKTITYVPLVITQMVQIAGNVSFIHKLDCSFYALSYYQKIFHTDRIMFK